jgi:hypothetical protein
MVWTGFKIAFFKPPFIPFLLCSLGGILLGNFHFLLLLFAAEKTLQSYKKQSKTLSFIKARLMCLSPM